MARRAVLFLWILCLAARGPAADWAQWRGPDRNGVTSEPSGWPAGWPPKRLWSRDVGPGCSSPLIVGRHVYVIGWQGKGNLRRNPVGRDIVYCLAARSGDVVWKRAYRARYQGRFRAGDIGSYGGPSSTPAFDPATGHLYTLGVDGDLRCWNAREDGRLVWAVNLYEKYKVGRRPDVGGGRRDYGLTSSPLLLGHNVVLEVGSPEGTVMAFEKETGRRAWSSRCKGPAGHTSGPVALTVDGTPCLATLALRKLVVMRADQGHEGETLAERPWQTEFACNLATPAALGRRLLVTSAYNRKRAVLFTASREGLRPAWTSKQHALLSSPVIHEGRAFLIFNTLRCLDASTGRLLWKAGGFGHGSCLATGDGKLIVFSRGRLTLIDPAADRYRELATVTRVVSGTCYPHVALANGLVCCRDRRGRVVLFSAAPRSGKE
ncbi:MAG: PQQ-binding-like beta-propeller repeat protein [Planctomycetota bacterium]